MIQVENIIVLEKIVITSLSQGKINIELKIDFIHL